ncbi:hypothetical protein M8J77_024856 [Diaphorina citri]|nr:hypothetical protein M8J77_024856 [Diaphorina citri]
MKPRKGTSPRRDTLIIFSSFVERALSPSVTQSLHHLIQCLQEGDYNGALAVHTQMVSGPDFSNIASFMPALKILIQIALQNGVYL